MRGSAVHAESQQFHTALLQVGIDLGKGDKFGSANRGKVSRMREQNQPGPLVIIQLEFSVSGIGVEIRRFFSQPW
jgi:hypothetical protein